LDKAKVNIVKAKGTLAQKTQASAASPSSPKPASAPAPSVSWPPGLYYLSGGSWHLLETDEQLESLVKTKTISISTPVVVVPADNMTPRPLGSIPALKEVVERILNQPSGFWSALKTGGKIAANLMGAMVHDQWTCSRCLERVRYGATVCPFCRHEIEYY
jgi:hypothetical protein